MPLDEATALPAGTSGVLSLKRLHRTTLQASRTISQRQRKREKDREAQKTARDKTKNHIAHLETLVQTLQNAEGCEGRESVYVAHMKNSREHIIKLREALKSINKIAQVIFEPLQAPLDDSPSRQISTLESTDGSQAEPAKQSQAGDRDDEVSSGTSTPTNCNPTGDTRSVHATTVKTPQSHQELPESLSSCANTQKAGFSNPASHVGMPLASVPAQSRQQSTPFEHLDEMAKQILQNSPLDGKLWYFAGALLNHIHSMPGKSQTDPRYTEDIIIRAVLHGWRTVTEIYDLDPGWYWVQQIDRTIFPSLGIPDRLAVLSVLRLQYEIQSKANAGSTLISPPFLEARPAQIYLEHDPLVEFFVWPGFRERLLFSPRKYATTRFMENFRNNYRFLWPFEIADTYVRDRVTDIYTFSDMFLGRQRTLTCWSMSSQFFGEFPELSQDFPAIDRLSLYSPSFRALCGPENDRIYELVDKEQVIHDGTSRTEQLMPLIGEVFPWPKE